MTPAASDEADTRAIAASPLSFEFSLSLNRKNDAKTQAAIAMGKGL